MRYRGAAVMLAASFWLPAVSQAKEGEQPSSIWAGCGDNKVSATAKFMVGPTAARSLTPRALPSEGIERCTTALGALPPDASWERHAALLRSRAKFYVAAKQYKAALADLDAIAAIEKPDAPYVRSFAVSLNMLRALAYMEAGQREDAAIAADKAMQARPWSLRVAQFAFALSTLRTKVPSGEKSLWNNLVRLDPDYFERRAINLARAGDWADALIDWQNAKPAPGEIGQTYINVPNVRVSGAPGIPITGVNVGRTAQAIIAAYVAARPDLADTWLARAKDGISAPREATRFERDFNIAAKPEEQRADLDTWAGLFEAAALFGKGDAENAAKKLEALSIMPFSRTTLALMRTVTGKLPPDSHAHLRLLLTKVEEQVLFDDNEHYVSKFDPGKLLDEIPDHEDTMLANPYQSAVKFIKANGFSVKVAKDGKTAEVSFFGNKSHPFAIGEMALLRAADLTVEQGKSAFKVIKNDDFVQTSTMTMYGTPVGPTTVAGHSTHLKIEFVDPSVAQERPDVIQADDVRAALMPIYVKSDAK